MVKCKTCAPYVVAFFPDDNYLNRLGIVPLGDDAYQF